MLGFRQARRGNDPLTRANFLSVVNARLEVPWLHQVPHSKIGSTRKLLAPVFLLVRRSWTIEEVNSLKVGMQEQIQRTGNADGQGWDWRAVSAHVPTRSAKQVHEKWLNDFMPGRSSLR